MHFSRKFQVISIIMLGVILLAVSSLSMSREHTPTYKTESHASDSSETTEQKEANQPINKTNESKAEATTLEIDNKNATPNQPDNAEKPQEQTQTPVQETEQNKPKEQVTTNNEPKEYNFNAKPGDSYTVMARDAVKQYSASNKLELQPQEIEKIAAQLAHNAGSPFLEIGQTVTIAKGDISALVNAKPQPTTAANPDSPKDNSTDKDAATTSETFEFTASTNDNYALLARRAIKEYTTDKNINMSSAQKIAAETFILSDSGFPSLEIGQQVTITQETVTAAVNKAVALTEAQLALWQPSAKRASI